MTQPWSIPWIPLQRTNNQSNFHPSETPHEIPATPNETPPASPTTTPTPSETQREEETEQLKITELYSKLTKLDSPVALKFLFGNERAEEIKKKMEKEN